MRQLLQDLKTGEARIIDAPRPHARTGQIVIQTRASLVSAGTERMLMNFGKASWFGKGFQHPAKLWQAIEKIKADGVLATVAAIQTKLDQPVPLGYSSCGVVVEVGEGVSAFAVGDRVVGNGPHAEYTSVPANLCARVPDKVSDDAAAFTVLGAIALHGIRLAKPTLGERFAVIGLGVIGLLAVQILRAHGCRVLAIDPQPERLRLAAKFGAEPANVAEGVDAVAAASVFTSGLGIDGILIAASTTSSDPVRQAARMSRKRGRIVLVGVTGLELSRADFYEKELSFQVSCSYGPGRYDPEYEEKGRDYPLPYVRWTEQRNFDAVLELMAQEKLDVAPLITHRFPLSDGAKAYEVLSARESSLGVIFEYSTADTTAKNDVVRLTSRGGYSAAKAVLGVVGAGNYSSAVLLPAVGHTDARRKTLVTGGSAPGAHQGQKHKFEMLSSDVDTIFDDPEINGVIIATRHDSHAALAKRALAHGKHVYIEKPLALLQNELTSIRHAYEDAGANRILTVGFNRRFAPQAQKMRSLLQRMAEHKAVVIMANAGAIPGTHWTQDLEIGGGRIIGEACHFIDLARFLIGTPISEIKAIAMSEANKSIACSDKALITLKFADGSVAAIHYLANGHRSFPKERVEVFCGGRILQLDNFRRLKAYGWPGFSGSRLWRQDKGNAACVTAFIKAIETGGEAPIPIDEIFEVSEATLRAAELLRC